MSTMAAKDFALLRSCRTEREWNDACATIKSAHGGYPADWYAKVVLSGLMDEVMGSGATEFKIVTFG